MILDVESVKKRDYADPCGLARALGVIGERWALLVVRELLFGPKRFTDLLRGLPHMSQNVLSQRLRELEAADVIRRKRLGPPVSAHVYALTQRGADLEPVLLAMARWGSRQPLPASGELSTDALMLALKTTFDPTAEDGLTTRVCLRLGDDAFRAETANGQLRLTRGEPDHADAVIEADAPTLRAIVFAGRPLSDARVLGDVEAARRFVAAFPRPTPA
jgi:DNA-binding HxlR family transcriptional regulator